MPEPARPGQRVRQRAAPTGFPIRPNPSLRPTTRIRIRAPDRTGGYAPPDPGASPDPGGVNGSAPPGMTDSDVRELAELLAGGAWRTIESDPEFASPEVRKALALCHFWCDLFVSLAVVLSTFQGNLKRLPDYLKDSVKEILLRSPRHTTLRKEIGDHLVDKLADHVWSTLLTSAKASSPILALLDSESATRGLCRVGGVSTTTAPALARSQRSRRSIPRERASVGARPPRSCAARSPS